MSTQPLSQCPCCGADANTTHPDYKMEIGIVQTIYDELVERYKGDDDSEESLPLSEAPYTVSYRSGWIPERHTTANAEWEHARIDLAGGVPAVWILAELSYGNVTSAKLMYQWGGHPHVYKTDNPALTRDIASEILNG